MISDARGGHVSPGVYTEEKDINYSVQSLGVTTLGLAGETLKGPAFEPVAIESWSDFTDYFGGTSPEKFKGNNLPKYELPYIAKEYLKQSRQLQVVRVLGLSGYEAGKAWCINAVPCSGCSEVPSTISAHTIAVLRSKGTYNGLATGTCVGSKQEKFEEIVSSITLSGAVCYEYSGDCSMSETKVEYDAIADKFGYSKFQLTVKYANTAKPNDVFNVSFNPKDAEYIYKVFGTDPKVGNAPLYVESVYDFAFNEMLSNIPDNGSGVCNYRFAYKITSANTVNEYSGNTVAGAFNEPFRCAQTPWVVSEVKAATTKEIDLKKLFKFYTISDGNAANYQVKISIANIRPDEGTFDVVVRDFYDSDASPKVLEKFSTLSMDETSSNYIAAKIGTVDGEFISKSKYITVRMAEGGDLSGSVPCGFLGYPMPIYKNGAIAVADRIDMKFNTKYDGETKPKRQYFGLNSNILDVDVLNYKGAAAYKNGNGDANGSCLTNGFHLDGILNRLSGMSATTIYVDGESGFKFTATDVSTNGQSLQRINTEAYMKDTIFADINLRKFTVYPYGGFDGWDIFREQRTNTDKYKSTKYEIVEGCPFKKISGGVDLNETLDLDLPTGAINSDYYAYLAGYRQFANPQAIDINLFATPGIDYQNNGRLVDDAIDVIEDKEDGRGGDALYLVTSPMYNAGNSDEILTSQEVSDVLDDSGIDSSYAATYWPWVKVYDAEAGMYVNLPVTKDVVRNMAETDNKSYSWFAAAGYDRGNVDCVKAVKKTKLADEDTLYENRINPVKSFAVDGVKIWGNKTLYSADSPLNRVNVRRLMIRVKKLVVDASKYLIFDQYDESLEKQFRGLVEPILSDVKSNRGISDYRVITECTAETRDQHILPAKILIKPVGALEWISLSFNVYPESVDFQE